MSAWRSFLKKTVKFAKFHERLFYSRLADGFRVAMRCRASRCPFRVVMLTWRSRPFRVAISPGASACRRTFVLVARFENFLVKNTKFHEHLFYSCSHFSARPGAFRVASLPGSVDLH
jgi:hypothetical protein